MIEQVSLQPMVDKVAAESVARLAALPKTISRVHLMGVAGTAMAALAGMLSESGFSVSGSDNQLYEPTGSLLKRLNVPVKIGFEPSNLAPRPDLVVVGNVIPRANPEAAALLQSGIPYLSMPEALWHFFLQHRHTLMIAGTHGKTTSTSMMAQVLNSAGRDPGMLVGGVAKNFGSNYRLGHGDLFVIEGDEYDTAFFDKGPKFLHYRARGTVLTAVEFDHADIYRDLDHVKASFRALADQMTAQCTMAVCADFPHALDVAAETKARRLTFGLRNGEYRADAIRIAADGARFSILRSGKAMGQDFHLPIGGRMNIANALGVYVLLHDLGLSDAEIAKGLASFTGVVRRQEVVGEAGGITVVDDFAHHPTAIAVTLEAVAERFAGRRLLAAFEPRSNTSRRSVFQAAFARAFDGAARVYLGPVYFKENDPIPAAERLAVDKLADDISSRGPKATACQSNDALLEAMLAEARAGDVALFMSNGPFDNLKERFLAAIQKRAAF